jgi:hypothetical protein
VVAARFKDPGLRALVCGCGGAGWRIKEPAEVK